MKRTIIKLLVMMIAALLLVGCSSKNTNDTPEDKSNSFTIGDLSMEYTEVEITEGATGNQALLMEDQAAEFMKRIKDIPFEIKNTSDEVSSWSYSILFRKDGTIVDSFDIVDENTIRYEDDIYQAKSFGIDMDYIKSIMYTTFEAEVIGAKDGLLITPDKESSVFQSSDKLSVNLTGTLIKNVDGEELTKEDIRVGDILKVTFNGVILESYPAQITATEIMITGRNIVMDGYMALIDDIYQEDSGLNSDIKTIAFDTSEWVELTDIEKEAILIVVREKYDVDTVEGTFDELVEQGFIDKEKLYFQDGILIKISNINVKDDGKKISCAIEKWRSGLGAIGSDDVTATYDDTEWKITKKNMWIS